MAGSAVVMPWLDAVSAALMVWYPGSEGGHAVADVLLDHAEPGGQLPFAVPRDEADLVDFDRDAETAHYGLLHGQWHLDANATDPHLLFGHGLGYTTFQVEQARLEGDRAIVTVANTGTRSGSTVVQVYSRVTGSAHERPTKRLVGFAKVRLDATESTESTETAIAVDRSLLDLRIGGAWAGGLGGVARALARPVHRRRLAAGRPARRVRHRIRRRHRPTDLTHRWLGRVIANDRPSGAPGCAELGCAGATTPNGGVTNARLHGTEGRGRARRVARLR